MASVCLAQQFTCPLEIDGSCRIGHYPDPTSCAHWYNCIPGWISGCDQTRYQCQQFEAFDKKLRQCILAIDANCDSKICLFSKLLKCIYILIFLVLNIQGKIVTK